MSVYGKLVCVSVSVRPPCVCVYDGYKIHVGTLTRENLTPIKLANMETLISQFVHPEEGRG